jgi:putative flavoprotein involved in K+ transport
MNRTEMSDNTTVVIGAGPAGLATAAELERRGVRAVVLERGDAVGASWRARYDRLRLNSSKWFSQLPGARYVRGTAVFPTRGDVVRYLDDYAADRRLDVRCNTRVDRIDRADSGWVVRTSAGDIEAANVIVATGYSHTPHIPAWPGRDAFEGRLLHAAEYGNARPFAGADVLVAGSGCSGMEIAYELAAEGAQRVRLAVRTSPNILIRSPLNPVLGRMLGKLPAKRADAVMRAVQRRRIGDLTEYGLPMPEEGVASRLRRLGVAPAIVDRPTIEAIKDGRVEIVAGVATMDAHGVELADGSRLELDAVIAATGYRTGLDAMVGHLGVLDERGVPRALRGEAAPGLRFVGYIVRPGQIGGMGEEARSAAAAVVGAAPRAPKSRRGAVLYPAPRPQAAAGR